MLPEDDAAPEQEPADEVDFVMFPAADQSAEVVEPSKEALDFPAAGVAAQFAAIRSALAAAIVLVGRDEPDAVLLPQALIKRIAVVSAVANLSFWFGSRGPLLDGVQEPGALAYDWTKSGEKVIGIITSSSASA